MKLMLLLFVIIAGAIIIIGIITSNSAHRPTSNPFAGVHTSATVEGTVR